MVTITVASTFLSLIVALPAFAKVESHKLQSIATKYCFAAQDPTVDMTFMGTADCETAPAVKISVGGDASQIYLNLKDTGYDDVVYWSGEKENLIYHKDAKAVSDATKSKWIFKENGQVQMAKKDSKDRTLCLATGGDGGRIITSVCSEPADAYTEVWDLV
ncbi:uncharacterized protein I303_104055 [Kwoniella dejecticola CBS 10117]|uniref:Ricin B lectin domain-containing protein n=1 Tax=Kwoniella dejecticola CBS 10117 TaxID=1296121 RepID=A0A1A6A8G7_9TREE|nr:uncharacterized protein I303_04074 [Kwoniella dejecticola CBS 10117]OBR86350.1 hypothetical protein I303_04074 [Kwoniella dejecticola CBS 10117]